MQYIIIYTVQIIKKKQWNHNFSNLRGKWNLVQKFWQRVWEIGGKITVFDWGKGMTFGLIYQKVQKIEDSGNQDSTVYMISLSFYDPPEDIWFTVSLVSYKKAIF